MEGPWRPTFPVMIEFPNLDRARERGVAVLVDENVLVGLEVRDERGIRARVRAAAEWIGANDAAIPRAGSLPDLMHEHAPMGRAAGLIS